MSEKNHSVVSALAVIGGLGAILLGSSARDRVDLPSSGRTSEIHSLLASRGRIDVAQPQTDIPAGDFFYELTEKLKQEYVEPIGDEQKLASGAIRGMIGSLGDPKSTFMDRDEFRVFQNARVGKYEGIGADLEILLPNASSIANKKLLQPTPSEEGSDPRQDALAPTAGNGRRGIAFPRLTVTSVVSGGPADLAGVKAGDAVYSVDDHWVINGDLAERFLQADKDFKAKKIGLAQLNELRKEVRAKYERMLLPLRAKDRLVLGSKGTVRVVWDRDGQKRSTVIQKAPSQRAGLQANAGVLTLSFVKGSPEWLRHQVTGKDSVSIDLRNNTLGDFSTMVKCLSVLAPSGTYGVEANQRGAKPTNLTVTSGNAHPPKITLLTDKTTRGAAEVFALSLSSKGLAKLVGSETGGAREVYDVVSLPDGSGYTLVTGRFSPELTVKKTAGLGVTANSKGGM